MLFTDYRQQAGFDCGLAEMQVVLNYYGWRKRDTVDLKNMVTPTDGIDPRTMESVFRRLGYRCTAGEMSLKTLRHLTHDEIPVICVVKDHYVTVASITARSVRYHDPSPGEDGGDKKKPIPDFLEWWKDADRLGAIYHQWAIAVWQ